MLRASLGTVKASAPALRWAGLWAAIGVLSIAAAGCYWSRYARLMETHLGLLLEYAAKLEGLGADGRRVPPEAWGEYTYPLERARDFSRIAAQRFPGRRSLVLFDRAIDLYAGLVATPAILDRADAAAEISRRVVELRAAAEEVRAALTAETS